MESFIQIFEPESTADNDFLPTNDDENTFLNTLLSILNL